MAALAQLQDLASGVGASVTSVETLPAETTSAYQRLGVRAKLSATWPLMVKKLRKIVYGTPRMLVDNLQLHATTVLSRNEVTPIDVSFVETAFRPLLPIAAVTWK